MSEQRPSTAVVNPVPSVPGRPFGCRRKPSARRPRRWPMSPKRNRRHWLARARAGPGRSGRAQSGRAKAGSPQRKLPGQDGAAQPRQGHDHVVRRPHWEDSAGPRKRNPNQAQGMFGKRRLSALAAVVALAAVAGALGGAMATAGLAHFATTAVASMPPRQQRAGGFGGADRRRHPGAEGQPRAHLQSQHRPVQQEQRPARQVREGASRARRQARQAQRSRRQARARPRRRSRLPFRSLPRPPRRAKGSHRLGDAARARQARRPRPKWRGCRPWKAGHCATSTMAAP